MKLKNFKDYIEHLKDNLESLQVYRSKCGKFDGKLDSLNQALKDADPFVVFQASVVASKLFSDKTMYH